MKVRQMLGLNFKSSPIDIRENYFFPHAKMQEIYREYRNSGADLFILNTCNRTEIFTFNEKTDLHSIFDAAPYDKRYFFYNNKDVEEYILRLLFGFESYIYGEAEIRDQMREAISRAFENNILKKEQYAQIAGLISGADQIIKKEGIYKFQDKLYDRFLLRLIKKYMNSSVKTVAVLGTGYIAEKILSALSKTDVQTYIFSNKNEDRARDLATMYNTAYDKMENIYKSLAYFDMVFSATAAPHRIIKSSKLKFSRKMQIFIDFSFPRDIDSTANELPNKRVIHIESIRSDFLSNDERRMLGDAYLKCSRSATLNV